MYSFCAVVQVVISTMGVLPSDRVYSEYNEADLIAFIDNATGIQVPGKLLELMATGKPILYIFKDTSAPSYDLISEYKGAFKCTNNAEDIETAIRNLMAQRGFLSFDFPVEQYYWDVLASRYYRLLHDLC